ncbi:hypothetical protein HRI_000655400 [Hibiscus trionum]|uniref:CRIB domain-containing protein n=1 Tax=Hibiscus trionum TaxID=183268 RepID=A0A9W7LN03_HIBTR|nr:hypothetical protein HRI_000655400 [Hibiscus trionum]
MKGFLRGLKHVSHIFEVEKEAEMQIGNPTDVKHVAHIGMADPSASKPSWMAGYNSGISSFTPSDGNQLQLMLSPPGDQDSLPPISNEKQKKSRSKQSVGSSPSAGQQKASEKISMRQRTPAESPNRDSTSDERQERHSSRGTELSSQVPNIPKKYRHKKSKRSCGGSEGSLSPAISNLEIKA